MKVEIFIVIISSITSIVIAIISLLSSLKTNKSLEQLKFQYKKQSFNLVIKDKELQKKIKTLELFIASIQEIKDILLLIINSRNNSVASEIVTDKLVEARENIFKVYENNMTNLSKNNIHRTHEVKNLTLNIEMYCKNIVKKRRFIRNLSQDEKDNLTEFRNNLSDTQNILRDSLMLLYNERINKNEY